MKTALLSLLLLLRAPWALAEAPLEPTRPNLSAPTVALRVATALPAVSAATPRPHEPATKAATPSESPGWREQLALLGAACAALLFILRRQGAQRLGEHPAAPARAPAQPAVAPSIKLLNAAPDTGYALSAFDNLPSGLVTASAQGDSPVGKTRRPAGARRASGVARRKARSPAMHA